MTPDGAPAGLDGGRRAIEAGPVAVGGVGGSGTRLVAECLLRLGLYLGQDLNEPLDNLWFTLLFKRREILVAPAAERAYALGLFFRRMRGVALDAADGAYARALAARSRRDHSAEWLAARAETLVAAPAPAPARWGWKEPNTHVLAEALLAFEPRARYVHLYRNGLEMAFNRNQQQARLWGPVFLGDDAEPSPRRSLAYWCAAHRRIAAVAARFPERVLAVRFETLIAEPRATVRRIADFAGLPAADAVLDGFADTIRVPVSRVERDARFEALDPADLCYLESLGFAVG